MCNGFFYLNVTRFSLLGFLFISIFSCSNNEKTWDDYVREDELEQANRIEEIEKQINDSLTENNINNLKQQYSQNIALVEEDFVNSIKAYDRENNENRLGKFKLICSKNNCTYFDLYILLTEKYKKAELLSRIKAIQSGLKEDRYYQFIGDFEKRFESDFFAENSFNSNLLLSFKNNYANCLGDNSEKYCYERKPQLPNSEYWGF